MTKKIYGDIEATHNITTLGKNTIRDINNATADSTGDLSFPYYTKEYVDKIMKVLPVSRVGTMDYLPMNINGSFEGATNYIMKGVYPVILENDGTLVYLRPGTNGSTFNYYYCYINNARTVSDFSGVVSTNEKFVPKIFTQSHTLDSFVSSNANDILMMRTNNGTENTYTLSLTNKTLNRDFHQSVEFPRTLISDTDPQYAMVHNDTVYIWGLNAYNNWSPLALSIYTISTNDIKNGVYTTLTKVTGINGVTLFNDVVTDNANIRITNFMLSQSPDNKALMCIEPENVYRNFSAYWGNTEGSVNAVGEGENIRVAIFHTCNVETQQQSSTNAFGISVVFNTSTKEYTIDNDKQGSIIITTDDNGIVTWNNPYTVDFGTQISGLNSSASLNRVPTLFLTNDGVQFCTMSRHDTFVEHYISRSEISNFTSLYEAWNFKTRSINNTLVNTISPIYGSAIGENLIHPTIISKNKILLHCSGTYNNKTFGPDNTVSTDLGNDRNFQYKSISTGGSISGYAPNTNRVLINNDDNKYTAMITVVNEQGGTEVYGSSFIEGYTNKPAGLLMNQNTMQFAGTLTLQSAALLTNLKSSMISQASLTYSAIESKIVLYYIPNNAYSFTAYAVVTLRDSAPTGTNNTYILLSEVNTSRSGNIITQLTVGTIFKISRGIAAKSISNGFMARNGGMIIAKYADFTYLGIPALFAVNSSASNFCSLVCKINNSTKSISGTPKLISTSYNSSTTNTYEVGVLPGVGFGLFENGNITDIKTKLIFKNFGTTVAQFDTMITNPASSPLERIVVASQDVPEGFVVYFSQEVPVLLGGVYRTLPISSIDLSTIDPSPANKTFYIYVVLKENIIDYLISTSVLSEELYRTYIGKVVTGSTNITTIESEKVSRFLKYRTSTTKRGSAIPTSTGTQQSTGTRWN